MSGITSKKRLELLEQCIRRDSVYYHAMTEEKSKDYLSNVDTLLHSCDHIILEASLSNMYLMTKNMDDVSKEHSTNIDIYGKYVDDFEISPFESLLMLHKRSKLEDVICDLTPDERIKLLSHDIQLIKNAKRMSRHIGGIYDFSLSTEPLTKWWWHLDKVAADKNTFRLIPVSE